VEARAATRRHDLTDAQWHGQSRTLTGPTCGASSGSRIRKQGQPLAEWYGAPMPLPFLPGHDASAVPASGFGRAVSGAGDLHAAVPLMRPVRAPMSAAGYGRS
jgi:hypothetical protein